LFLPHGAWQVIDQLTSCKRKTRSRWPNTESRAGTDWRRSQF